MNQLQQRIEKISDQVRKQSDSEKWQEKRDSLENKRYEILNATSECPYGKCDGKGIMFIWDKKSNVVSGRTCKCKENLRASKLLEFAEFPEEFFNLTIDSFNIDLYKTKKAKEIALISKREAISYIENFDEFQENGKGIYLYSNAKGSGKTRLAASIGNALVKHKEIPVKFTKTIELLNTIRQSYEKSSKYSQIDIINGISEVPVLILDDVGVEKQSPWVNEIFYSIVDGRMTGNRVTIFTSNTRIENLNYDERIRSRIEKMAVPIYLPNESIRYKLAKEENEYFTTLLLQK